MLQPILSFHLDDENHWVATLACGHTQHVRHHPPLYSRPWVTTPQGRQSMLNQLLPCQLCDGIPNTPPPHPPHSPTQNSNP